MAAGTGILNAGISLPPSLSPFSFFVFVSGSHHREQPRQQFLPVFRGGGDSQLLATEVGAEPSRCRTGVPNGCRGLHGTSGDGLLAVLSQLVQR